MIKYSLIFIWILSSVVSKSLAQEPKQRHALWISSGFAQHRTFHDMSSEFPQRTFAITHQNEYRLISIGYQVRSNFVAYISLEYNTFMLHSDFSDYAKNQNVRRSRSGLPFAPHETVFLQKIEKSRVESILFPSISVERRVHIYKGLNLSFGASISEYRGKAEYYYQGTWAYGGNGVNQFESIEANTVTSPRRYWGTKVSTYLIPEWKMGHWTLGTSFGIQYKRFTTMMSGESVSHKSQRIERSGWFHFAPQEIGLVSGIRLSHEISLNKRAR